MKRKSIFVFDSESLLLLIYFLFVKNFAFCSEFVSLHSSDLKYWENKTDDLPKFSSLDSVIRFLSKPEYDKLQPVNKILYAFNTLCMSGKPAFSPVRRRAFIAIEGNHKTTMDILSKRLAKTLSATFLKNPPGCLAPYRSLLMNGTPLCKAYYDLGLYAIAQRVRMIWNQYNVVVKGYWIDQLLYTIATQGSIPPSTSPQYQWPRDLLVPDLIIFIDVPGDEVFTNLTTRPPNSWKNRCPEIYRNIKFITVHPVTTLNGMDQALKDIQNIITMQLASKFHIQFIEEVAPR